MSRISQVPLRRVSRMRISLYRLLGAALGALLLLGSVAGVWSMVTGEGPSRVVEGRVAGEVMSVAPEAQDEEMDLLAAAVQLDEGGVVVVWGVESSPGERIWAYPAPQEGDAFSWGVSERLSVPGAYSASPWRVSVEDAWQADAQFMSLLLLGFCGLLLLVLGGVGGANAVRGRSRVLWLQDQGLSTDLATGERELQALSSDPWPGAMAGAGLFLVLGVPLVWLWLWAEEQGWGPVVFVGGGLLTLGGAVAGSAWLARAWRHVTMRRMLTPVAAMRPGWVLVRPVGAPTRRWLKGQVAPAEYEIAVALGGDYDTVGEAMEAARLLA